MRVRKWTQEQWDAINASGRTILVSAAAGSGKTAALSQRVINKITDKNNPCDADKLLIVTFTRAAAAEMRERISALVSQMLEQNPSDFNLRRQQSLLKSANICTIHSFCNNVVRENFYRLGISPNFRIADDNEISLLQEKAIGKVLDKFYEEADPRFFELVELFSTDKEDSALVKVVIKLYKFVVSCPFHEEWFKENRAQYKSYDIPETVWGKVLIQYVADTVDFCEESLKSLLGFLSEDVKEFYSEALFCDLTQIQNLKQLAEQKSWDNIIESLNIFKKARRKSIKSDYKDNFEVIYADAKRDEIRKSLDKLKKYFSFYSEDCQKDLERVYPLIDELFKVTEEFIKEFSSLKLSKNIAEFSDLENWMIELLSFKDENGKIHKSAVAQEICSQYDEIMVDEYQDTNEIQDMIFKMVSKDESNLFMVGDVKQSIYGFRQAMPKIFMSKKESYYFYDANKNDKSVKIILGKNFRSRKGIIDAVNFVFSKIMSRGMGGIHYGTEEMLISGALYPENGQTDTQIEILELAEGEDIDKAEATKIAQIICSMIEKKHMIEDGDKQRPVTYRDFCILLRSANKRGAIYAKELNNRGVPAWSESGGKFFGTWEISSILSFLRVIDNPIQDIPLSAVLISPMFGFTPDELSAVRIAKKDEPLYFGVKALADNGDKKCIRFMEKIDKYRTLCSFLTVEKLINYIYEDTGYTSIVLAMTNGTLRLANLRMLAEYSAKYDGAVYTGLPGFIEFIDKLQEQKSDLSPASVVSEASNVVKIMSIHKSKGLEFPICIIARCSGKFNKEHSDVILHKNLGLGISLKDKSGFFKYSNFIRNSAALECEKDEIAEELRVLYVAMTRAKEKLIFLVSVKNLEKAVQSSISPPKTAISPYIVRHSSSFSDWILKCVLMSKSGKKLYDLLETPQFWHNKQNLLADFEINITRTDSSEFKEHSEGGKLEPEVTLPKEVQSRFNFGYPHADIKHIQSKIAASALAHSNEWVNYIAYSAPSFTSPLEISAQEKGTAFHEFLHFVDYNSKSYDVSEQISYLKNQGFLTQKQALAINQNQARAFLSGALAQRIRKSDRVLREYKFTVSIPIGEIRDIHDLKTLAQNDENVIVQGAIDCVFKEDNHYIIVDYKTDRTQDLATLKAKYSRQLYIYKYAFELCEESPVQDLLIYSIPLNACVKL